MLINLKNIQQFFSDHASCLKEHNTTPCIAGLASLPDSPDKYRDYLLYTCTDKTVLTSIPTIPDMHIVGFLTVQIRMIWSRLPTRQRMI